jgi:pimeloyl-ACP methyl ester carboxylesterase
MASTQAGRAGPSSNGLVEVAPGFRTRVIDEGATGDATADGAAMVLLHGTPLDADAWDPLVPALVGRRVVRFDARGHGVAAAVAVGDYARLAADVIAVLDMLELPDAHVVGHSWGGQIAQRVVLEHPERVCRLSLLCTRASPFPSFHDLAVTLRSGKADIEALLQRWFTPAECAQPDGVAATVRHWLQTANVDRWADAFDMISTFDDLDEFDRITVAADVIAAELDAVATPQHMARMADAMPCGVLHILAGARHLVPLQRPAEIARVLLAPPERHCSG